MAVSAGLVVGGPVRASACICLDTLSQCHSSAEAYYGDGSLFCNFMPVEYIESCRQQYKDLASQAWSNCNNTYWICCAGEGTCLSSCPETDYDVEETDTRPWEWLMYGACTNSPAGGWQ
jgi:hypothetical protein